MKYAVLILLLVVGTVTLYLFTDTPEVRNYPPKNDIIVAFGDSLVAGVGSTEGNDFVSVLERKLERNIVNLGKPGDTSESAKERLSEIERHDPGIVILLLGGNDFIRRIPESMTRENLAYLIQKLEERGAIVVLVGVQSGLLIDGRGDMYEELHETYGTVYVADILHGVFGKPEHMFDSIHPNDSGYEIIANRILSAWKHHAL